MTAYGEQRYADALEAVRGGLEQMPDHAGLHHRVLQPAWSWRGGAVNDATFRRGKALPYVSISDDAILLSVDYQGYAGPGH
jgi:hypothetical protein